MLRHKVNKCCTCGRRKFVVNLERDNLWQCPNCIRLDARLKLDVKAQYIVSAEQAKDMWAGVFNDTSKLVLSLDDEKFLATMGVKWNE